MAAGVINLQKASGGVTKITSVDGVGITNLVVPESGTLATLESPVFTGTPTAPTPTAGDNSTKIATTAYVMSNGVPTGMVIPFAASTAPAGYLKANGALISRTTYSNLFTAIGTTFGAGDGNTTFALPDLRGYFPRGWDDGRGVDTGRVFGSLQADGYLNHSHTANSASAGAHTHTFQLYYPNSPNGIYVGAGNSNSDAGTATTSSAGAHTHTITVNASTTGGTETRPKNIALLYCIKY